MKLFTTIIEEIVPKTFVLTESQAFDLLLEAASLGDVHEKYYSQIPEEEFRQIVSADPTAGNNKMGKYSKWLLSLYINGEMPLEDLYKATDYLTVFHKYKGKLEKKDIGQYKSLSDLYNAIEPYEDGTIAASHKEEIRQIKQGAKRVYEDNEWLVIVPETKEAAIEYGKGTQWCTAATGSYNMFDYYNKQGPLYINIYKKTGQKLQFHFDSNQFMDETDAAFNRSDYNITEGLFNFYYKKYGDKALKLIYSFIGNVHEGLRYVTRNVDNSGRNKANFINDKNELISKQWFDWANEFSEGIAVVGIDNKCNFIDKNGNILLDKCYDECITFRNGFGVVAVEVGEYKRKYNYVNKKGEFLSPDLWFDGLTFFDGKGIATVDINKKEYLIRSNGTFVSEEGFDKIQLSQNNKTSFCSVKVGDKWNLFNFDTGKYIGENWFDYAYVECGNYFMVGLKNETNKITYNVMRQDCTLLFEEWYDWIAFYDDFNAGDVKMIILVKNSMRQLADKNGEILTDRWYNRIDECDDDFIFFGVEVNGKFNFLSVPERKLVSEIWFDTINNGDNFDSWSQHHIFLVNANDKYNVIRLLDDGSSTFVFNEWFDLGLTTKETDAPFALMNRGISKLYFVKKDGDWYEVTNEAKRRSIVITESQAFDLLLEAASLGDVYQKYYSQIPEDEFRQIVAADPTSGEDKMGKYSKWLLSLYINGEMLLEDLYKATDYLTTFHKYKGKLEKKDIGQYKSLPDLYNAIEPYEDGTIAASHKEELRQIKAGAKKVYEDDEWLVVVPETKEAAIEYGKNTKWCTAATGSQNMFDYYHSQGTIYININKKTGKKLQFHFEKEQFMDETDNLFDKSEYHINDGLFNFYKQKYGKKALNLRYDIVLGTSEGLTQVIMFDYDNALRKHNFVDKNYDLVSPDLWFNNVSVFSEGFAAVYVAEMGCNYLKPDGTFLFKTWKDWYCHSFYNGFGTVQHQFSKGYNAVNKNGELVSPNQWFSTIGYFENNLAKVGFDDGGYNIIRTDGSLVFENNYKYIGDIRSTYIKVKTYMDRYIFVNLNDELLINDNFVDASDFLENDYVWVKKIIDGKLVQNFLTKNGDFMFKDWYDSIGGMPDEKFMLGKDGKKNIGDKNGNILFDEWYDSINVPNNWGSFYYVKLYNKNNIINAETGEKVLDTWADRLYKSENSGSGCHVVMVKINKMYNTIFLDDRNCQAHIMFEEWFNLGVTSGGNVDYEFLLTNEPNCKPLYLISKDGSISDPREVQQESKQHNRSIIITEEQYGQILNESQESKSIAKAKKLLVDSMGWSKERADKFVRKDLRDLFSVLHHNSKAGKFILGLTRMYCNRQLTDGGQIQRLNSTLELVSSDAHINEYDQNLNGLSPQELINRFAGARQEIGNRDREENAGLDLQVNNDYTIVQIDNFEEAKKYGQYTSWCVTHSERMIDSYTSSGIGQFYFCLRNGFENVPAKRGEGCPLDEYGLSMVAVSVDGDGNLNTCTCRWNHDNGGDDHIMDTKQISQLIGRNFYDVFKPNNKWQKVVDQVIQRLANKEQLHDIFDSVQEETNYAIVRLKQMYNFVRFDEEGWAELGSKHWFKSISTFNEKYLEVYNNSFEVNLVNIVTGELVFSQWFDRIDEIENAPRDLFRVKLEDETYNIFDQNGEMLLPEGMCNFIEGVFYCGYLEIHTEKGQNYVDENGKLLSPNQWFDYVYSMHDNFGIVCVPSTEKVQGGYNFIGVNGKLLSPNMNFSDVQNFVNGFGIVAIEKDGCYIFNFITPSGKLVSPNLWFDWVDMFSKLGFAEVKKDDKYNVIRTDGSLVSPNLWFDGLFNDFRYGFLRVKLDGKYNYLKLDGKLVSPNQWFDGVTWWTGGFGIVSLKTQMGRLSNYIDENGNLLSPNQWFIDATFFHNGVAAVRLEKGENWRYINTKGEFVENPEKNENNQRGRSVIITEEQYRQILNESQESKSIEAAKTLVMKERGYSKEEADKFVRVTIRETFPNLRSREGGKFILGVTRIVLRGEINTGAMAQRLNDVIPYVASEAHINEYDRNLNGLSAEDLITKFEKNVNADLDKDREENAALNLQENNDYSIVQIDTFEEANKFSQYTDWCVTHYASALDSYTSGGMGQFYFCLKRGFVNVPKEPGDGCPLDEYGLSMVAVSVNENGKLNTCTCRWNHDNGGNDNIMDTKQISQLIGRNFYEVFKPNNKWQITLEDAMQKLANGDALDDVFDWVCPQPCDNGWLKVQLKSRYNFVNDKNQLVLPQWYAYLENFVCGTTITRDENGKRFIIDESGNILFNRGFDYVSRDRVHKDILIVEDERLGVNFIKPDGQLNNEWFDAVSYFGYNNRIARVETPEGTNYIRQNGEYVSQEWFDDGDTFEDRNYTEVKKERKYNLMDENGNILLPQWYDEIHDYYVNNLLSVSLDGKHNYLDTNGNPISKIWFDDIYSFSEGFAQVKANNLYNFIDSNGQLITDQWFKFAHKFVDGCAVVTLDTYTYVQNYLTSDRKFLSNTWFKEAQDFQKEYHLGRVISKEDEKCYIINKNGEIISDGYDVICMYSCGFAKVIKTLGENGEGNMKYNFIDTNGKLLSPNQWFDFAESFYDDDLYFGNDSNAMATVSFNGVVHKISADGTLTPYSGRMDDMR